MARAWEDKIRKVEPYTPGEQPKDESVIKLNTNENPYGVSPEVKKMADNYKMEPDKLKDLMGEEEVNNMKRDLKMQKAVEFVTENCKESKPRSTKKKAEAEE